MAKTTGSFGLSAPTRRVAETADLAQNRSSVALLGDVPVGAAVAGVVGVTGVAIGAPLVCAAPVDAVP
jgi:hypothetical protein